MSPTTVRKKKCVFGQSVEGEESAKVAQEDVERGQDCRED